MNIKYDSKLFCGAKLGTLDVEIPKLKIFITEPETTLKNSISYIHWVNTQIADDIFLDVWYPYYGAPLNETYLYINLLQMPYGRENMTLPEMVNFIGNIHFDNYENILKQLDYTYREPLFYTQYYVYCGKQYSIEEIEDACDLAKKDDNGVMYKDYMLSFLTDK